MITMNGMHTICNISLLYNDYLQHELIGYSGNLILVWRIWYITYNTFRRGAWVWCYYSARILRNASLQYFKRAKQNW